MSQKKQECGIIMPISSIDGCHESHWSEVLIILKEVIVGAGLKGDVVSFADEVGIIQKRIIDNLYNNDIVICDVSGKNPNVMFELGMRLAFDKPTIIIKDDCTSYSFDTSPIEHLEYPRDLNYVKINIFKERLAAKIKAQLEAVHKDGAYSPFLKHFGTFTVAKLDQKEISGQDYIVEQLAEISRRIGVIERRSNVQSFTDRNEGSHGFIKGEYITYQLPRSLSDDDLQNLISQLFLEYDIYSEKRIFNEKDPKTLRIYSSKYDVNEIRIIIDTLLEKIKEKREKISS